ncbi:type II toxin-antitoxin system RelE/ParE family toxin [uncultured Algibacter sp.]|uniref:type II toxin-antitoxin system RelE/ParE family toxin n=1 Tax=uncultured Algibacter sp. TaxID=298659 RepID=UPI00260A4BC7|nr:type II toxin-antitoxin system RelE/ParE family toxin [uncultured Algibacter sp.]
MANYKLSGKAEADLIGIYTYSIRNFGLKQSRTYLKDLESFFNELATRPELERDASLFAHGLKFYNYQSHVIFYQFIDTNHILIVRVLGKHMDFIQHL